MKKLFLLCFLNEANCFHKNKGWQVSTLFETFPTVDEILDHSCLLSEDPNDVKMAKMLVEGKGAAVRFVYERDKSAFFETMIIQKDFGEAINLWDYLHTGYADLSGRIIKYEDRKPERGIIGGV